VKKNIGIIFLLIMLLVLSITENYLEMTSPTYSSDVDYIVTDFSENILLSTVDYYLPKITEHLPDHVEPTLAISDNDTLFAGWKNARTHNGGGVRNSFTRSNDYGKTWETPVLMPEYQWPGHPYWLSSCWQSDPWLVWANGTLFYANIEFMNVQGYYLDQITVSRSKDYGSSWTSVGASGEPKGAYTDKETMTVDSNGIIYVGFTGSNAELRGTEISSSTDGGQSFQSFDYQNESDPLGYGFGFYLTTDSSNTLWVAWLGFSFVEPYGFSWDVYIAFSDSLGQNLSQPIDLNSESQSLHAKETDSDGYLSRATLPVIRFDQYDRLHVIWAEWDYAENNWDIFYRFSDDYAKSFSSRFLVNPEVSGDQWQPDFDIDSQGRLHVVYYDEYKSKGDYRPFYRRISFSDSDREIVEMTEPISLADKDTPAEFTRPGDYFTIRLDSTDTPHVVWTDGRSGSNLDIYYAHGILKLAPPTTTTTLTEVSETSISTITSTSTSDWMFTLPLLTTALVSFLSKRRQKLK
jgi:hypothetical protein